LQAWSKIWDTASAKLESLGLRPRTRLARFTFYVAAMVLLLYALEWLFRRAGAASVAESVRGWTGFLGFFVAILVVFLALRWFRNHVMWSVRSRLIVTYLFMGAIPVTLAIAMAAGTMYFAVEHLAVYLAVSEIQAQGHRLAAANQAAVERISQQNASPDRIMASDTIFPGRTITVVPRDSAPPWVKDGFAGLVCDEQHLYLRAANTLTAAKPSFVISSIPLDANLLGKIMSQLGTLTIFPKQIENAPPPCMNGSAGPKALEVLIAPAAKDVQRGSKESSISAGKLTAQQASLDLEIRYGGSLERITNWDDGARRFELLSGSTRPSAMYALLSASTGTSTGVLGLALVAAGIAFAVVVLIALIIGIRLTRTITYSVANLYKATEHINRGDFSHRIKVREKDQLAALQTAFNSMTESLEKLIVEQKEKERLQSELEIAHEVQAQLFPQAVSGTRTLELHGVCRPARIVSGDYYDFLSYGPEQMGIAVGDISGKGISAALLMATIHSAVRAYEQEQLAPVTAISAHASGTRLAMVAPRVARPSPSQMLWLLNRHLYRSTQPEKYATLFLGFYDDEDRCLMYSNAGHLPPIILSEDGSTRRLETGGTVVGLFDDREYEEQTVQLHPGDLFIAFSDGMTEPENEFGEFGEQRLIETIAAHRHLPLDRISEHAIAAVQDWIGSTEQPDDVTLVLARRIA
jgi:phosphoserine phosphatase RsbU/P